MGIQAVDNLPALADLLLELYETEAQIVIWERSGTIAQDLATLETEIAHYRRRIKELSEQPACSQT